MSTTGTKPNKGAAVASSATTANCSVCSRDGASKSAGRLPNKWKRFGSRILCADCKTAGYVMRAITIPVAEVLDGEWKEFYDACYSSWAKATSLANWAVTELAKNDVVRQTGDKKIEKSPPIYLYGLAGESYRGWSDWDGAKSSAQSLFRAVEKKYNEHRFNVIWMQSESLPNHKFPQPYPVHNQDWSAAFDEHVGTDGQISNTPSITFTVGGRQWKVRLRGGHEFRRQLGVLRQILSGEAEPGEIALLGEPARQSDHRPGGKIRRPGGGRSAMYRPTLKICGWFPKQAADGLTKTLHISNGGDSFWAYRVEDGETRYLHADHIRRWINEHKRKLDRMSDDLKREKRWPKETRLKMVQSKEGWMDKHHNRIDSFTHEATAMIAGYAARQKVGLVVYDVTNKSFVDSFPWHAIEEKLRYKLEDRGIRLEITNGATHA